MCVFSSGPESVLGPKKPFINYYCILFNIHRSHGKTESILKTASYFEHLLLEVIVGNDIEISIRGDLELFCNFRTGFNHLENITTQRKIAEALSHSTHEWIAPTLFINIDNKSTSKRRFQNIIT